MHSEFTDQLDQGFAGQMAFNRDFNQTEEFGTHDVISSVRRQFDVKTKPKITETRYSTTN